MLSASEYRELAQGKPALSEEKRLQLRMALSTEEALDGVLGNLRPALEIEGVNGNWQATISPSQISLAITAYIAEHPDVLDGACAVFARQMVSYLAPLLCARLEKRWGYATARIGDFGGLVILV